MRKLNHCLQKSPAWVPSAVCYQPEMTDAGILYPAVRDYLVELASPPDSVLAEMRAHGDRDNIPILDADSARALMVIAEACGARRVVEVGTAIGVSTLHLARAVGDGGSVTSFEIDEQRHNAARDYLTRAGLADRVDLRLIDAGVGLTEIEPGVDLVFLDGVKDDYPRHLELAIPLLRPGGLLAVDNTLLSGGVATGRAVGHWSQESIDRMREFNQRLVAGDGLVGMVLPTGDGLAIAVRR
jgi:caffeoyl-CoA O-methyltransferase